MIKCSECGKDVSDKASACIGCGAPIEAAIEPAAAATPEPMRRIPMPPPPKKKGSGCGLLIAGAIVLVIMSSCFGNKKTTPTSSGPKPLDNITALTHCQSVLKGMTRDPEKAEVPYVNGKEYSDSFSFTWGPGTKMIRARNGFGLEVGTTGECTVSKTTRKITRIGIDGNIVNL